MAGFWAATDKGVACLDQGHWHVYRQANGEPVLSGDNLFEGQGGEIFVTARHRLFRLIEGHFVEFLLPSGIAISKGTLSHAGDLWIFTEKQLATFHGSTWQSIALPPEITAGGLLGVAAAHDGGVWVAGASHILKFRNGIWTTPFRAPDDFRFTGAVRLLEDSDRNLWCGDQSRGLLEFRPDGRTLRFTHEDGLPSLAIRSLFEDRENNVWVGTHGGGMTRFRHRAAYLFHETSNSDETQIDTVAARAAGQLLLATYEGGLIQFDEGSMRFGAVPEYRGDSRLATRSRVLAALEDQFGTIWTNLSGAGLFRIRGSLVEEQSPRELEGKTIFEDSRGTVWIGTYFGIARQESGKFKFYRAESGLPQGLISAIGEDQEGGIWVGGEAGLFHWKDGRFEKFLPSGTREYGPVTSLFRSRDGALWIGLENGGLDRLWNGILRHYGAGQGLPPVKITSVIEDDERRLWLATFHDGLLCVPIESFDAVAAQQRQKVAWIWLKKEDGLETNAFRYGYQPAAAKGKNGRLWFATLKGLVMVDPKRVGRNSVVPPVRIEAVGVNGGSIAIDPSNSAAVRLPAGSRRIQFSYTALSFTAPEHVRFQYRLDGSDADWVETNQRVADFGYLRPGGYSFRVKAANNDGLWNPDPAVVRIQVAPFLWEVRWVQLLAIGLLVGASTLGVYGYQRQKLLQRTMQLRREQELRRDVEQLQAILKVSEERFATAFNASPIPLSIATLDDGRYVEVNESFLRITGLRREEVIGRTRLELDIWSNTAAIDQGLEVLKSGGRVSGIDVQLHDQKGQIHDLIVSAESIDLGGVRHAMAAALDITERKRLEEQLSQTQKLESIGRLSGGVAHDFNNLLTVINGYSSVLLASPEIGEPNRKRVQQILQAGDRAADLTRQLLAFSRKAVIDPKPMNLNDVVSETETMLQRLLPENIEMLTFLDPALGRIMADTTQMHQIVLNLALNARDAMPEGGRLIMETSNVELDAQFCTRHPEMTAGPCVLLAVTDTGFGMEESIRERIFEPFFTTKAVGQGTGLGLATVYGIVRQSDGWISVYSEPGTGTTFKVYLPRLDAAGFRERQARPESGTLRGTETVLVVDDQLDVRGLITDVLQRDGYRVLEAGGGAAALELARRHSGPIHLLLTDLGMRGMTGEELSRNLRALRPETRVVYVSGYTENAAIQQGAVQLENAFLSKPLTPDALLAKVRQTLDGPAVTKQ